MTVTAGADLFVCGDHSNNISESFENFSNLVAYRTAEDDGGYEVDLQNLSASPREHEHEILDGLEASVQWWRLQQCWKLVQKFEQRYHFRYSFYMKMRTDCDQHYGCYSCRETYKAAVVQKLFALS